MVVIIFAIISCVPASDRKTVVTSPVTVIVPARMKVTQFECFFPYALRGKTSNDDKITTTKLLPKNKKITKLPSSPTMVTK